MNCGDYPFIWAAPHWPAWRWDAAALAGPLAEASWAQGLLLGRLADAGLALRTDATLAALTEEAVKTSEIEGERLDAASVRSSLARRLGVEAAGLPPSDRHVEGVVDLVLDATAHCAAPLTAERLMGWHGALFLTGRSGLRRIRVGAWRDDATGPMQVVSGPAHRPKVHFEAPPAERVPAEMSRFLAWANETTPEPALIKAGLAHLWFVTIHPFEDGNGRIARALGDLFLARAEASPQRFYSLSAQIRKERKAYYEILERTQKGDLDVTPWLAWFLGVLLRALQHAHGPLDAVLMKARFWRRWGGTALNDRQIKLVNRLLDGFEGKLTTSKAATLTRCSPDTALRDLQGLLRLGLLRRTEAGGRSTAYELPTPGPEGP